MMHFATPNSSIIFVHFVTYAQKYGGLMPNSPMLGSQTVFYRVSAIIHVISIC
jgi:hypothetical protein